MDVFPLSRQGLSIRAVARKLGIHRNTVRKYLQSGSVPSYRKSTWRNSILPPYYQTINDFLEEDAYHAYSGPNRPLIPGQAGHSVERGCDAG